MENEKRLDLIDRQALGIGRCNPDAFPLQNRGYVAGWNGVINLLEQAPRVDAVEVVRCKDCEHWDKIGVCDLHTEVNAVWMDAEDFCSKGERRNNDL